MQYQETYQPTDQEEYMNPRQVEYFRSRLLAWRCELMNSAHSVKSDLRESTVNTPDIFDVASKYNELEHDIKDMERARARLALIDKALEKINSGEYGYCELTGDEIGIGRLQAQPVATLCIEVQELLEKNNREMRHQPGYAF